MEQRNHRIRSNPVQRNIKELGEDAQEIYKAAEFLAGLDVWLSRMNSRAFALNDTAEFTRIKHQQEALNTARAAVNTLAAVWLEKPAQFVLVSNMGYCDDFHLLVNDEEFRIIKGEDVDQDQAED